MPLARALVQIVVALACLAAAGCETAFAPPPPRAAEERAVVEGEPVAEVGSDELAVGATARPPRELWLGADMVIQRVEPEVARAEVGEAVQQLVADARFCTPMPTVWLAASERNGRFVVRFDLMRRDWGADVAASAQSRMEDMVAMGFLTRRDVSEVGIGAVEYTLTREGRLYLRGAIDSGQRPAFCAPAERRVVEITAMEWGQFPCGTLRVRFTHTADAWPAWATTASSRQRLEQTWPPLGENGYGEVSLSRQWFRVASLPRGARNGALVSACLDDDRERVIANDLNLSAPPPY
ncbi:MAG: hypothetical protein DCF16_07575 [Alphaproteobacteria bacterium]|nr:MAG: hypothetical protein DCF16_07575 [Alphaproteobacteria bacterium]